MGVEARDLCWLNGEILPISDAKVGIEDRGFQFADGVYEAIRTYNHHPFALRQHLDRLDKSCEGMMLTLPISRDELTREIFKLIELSKIPDAVLYLQLTRGEVRRNHVFPKTMKPTLLFYLRPAPAIVPIRQQPGVKLITVPDKRWRLCWIKSVGLGAHMLARNEAQDAGADEAAFVDDCGVVAECTSSNLFAVIGGKLVTHPVGDRVLRGVTRDVVIECARSAGIEIQEREPHLDEAQRAREVFITSTTRQLLWVRNWDERIVASACGEVTQRLSDAFDERVRAG